MYGTQLKLHGKRSGNCRGIFKRKYIVKVDQVGHRNLHENKLKRV